MRKINSMIRRLYAHYQSKLLMAFLLCTFLPICIIIGIAYKESYGIAQKQILDAAYFSSNQANAQINAHISQTESVSDALQFNMYALLQSEQFKESTYVDSFTNTRNDIDFYKSSFGFIHIFTFLKDDQPGSHESIYFFPMSSLAKWGIDANVLGKYGSMSLWKNVHDVDLPSIYSSNNRLQNAIVCCRSQYNQETSSLDYAFVILLDDDLFRQYINYPEDSPIQTYILSDDNSMVISSSEGYSPHLSFEEAVEHSTLQAGTYSDPQFTYVCLPLKNGWIQVTEIPKSYIAKSTMGVIRRIVIAALIFVPLTSLAVLYYVKKLSFKINALAGAMNNYSLKDQGSDTSAVVYDLPANPLDYDEIDTLCISFENMQHSINASLDSIVNHKVTEERLRYQLLQSQINPHFLYNILGSIKYCQSLGKLNEASQMLTDLTKFYRLSLRKSGELILIHDEFEIAETYLKIEKLCQKGNLTWNIDMEEGIENFCICKFTIQPFIENSILHGITEKKPNLDINISATYGESTVIIVITDNGCGIEKTKLEEIRRQLSEKTISYDHHFGISNVNRRISSPYYGNGKVTIESEPDQGTTITIEFDQLIKEE